jgi:membrane-bound metal-dependent hydrolase YbcI (DUF457 family)
MQELFWSNSMPDWKTHFIFSLFLVIAWISIFYFTSFQLGVESIISVFVLTVFTSLFPDIDMRRSKIRDVVSFATAAVIVGAYLFFYSETWYYAPVYFALLYLILKYIPTKHRGIAHTFKFSILFSVVLAAITMAFVKLSIENFLFWFFIVFSSYSLHLFIDRF